ncbi:hypothetical protein O6H91_09G103200 [Diphasiastrum complanatum]|uniref:Uncharacterized protein n=1 Tax=Diphasiastrum complanatum TaxID=34168 RepID=A0ACC2CT01_DIPCM|nr:hypothetical protein O6H91_09G103200 [Diphasiastrum complanatum]
MLAWSKTTLIQICSKSLHQVAPWDRPVSNFRSDSHLFQKYYKLCSSFTQQKKHAKSCPRTLPVQVAYRQEKVGAFQQLPMVAPSSEILGMALRRAKIVRPTKGISNIAKRERNRGAKQLDALMKELSVPLRIYLQEFPERERLHLYEQSLLELTLGEGKYEEVLENVDAIRKKILNVGKNYASVCAKGFSKLEELYRKHGKAVDDLKDVAKILRAMPVVHLHIPTLCLVGAPNVGKSSLVRVLSSGKPEVCNYPFTTRGISMGHIFVNSETFQVTDTPGLLRRPDDERNNLEKLTLAALNHLPTAVLYVHDLTGDCGTSVQDQFHIYQDIKRRFSDRPWIDVVSKADLLSLQQSNVQESIDDEEFYRLFGPPGCYYVSVETKQGLDELHLRIHSLLAELSSACKNLASVSSNGESMSMSEQNSTS